jgi:hypothetical protein
MRSLSTATFRKHKTCPASEVLMLYHDATLTNEAEGLITDHLAACDFCAAEMQLLSKFPPKSAPTLQPVRMPWHLYRLAKDLLAFSASDIARTVEAIYDTRNLSLTDA